MKIKLLSDLHQERYGPYQYRDDGEDVVILAGDIDNGINGIEWAKANIIKPVIYVSGNHEFWCDMNYSDALDAMRTAAAGSNVHFLECDSVVIDGVRFLGATMWTNAGEGLLEEKYGRDYALFTDAQRLIQIGEVAYGRFMNDQFYIKLNNRNFTIGDVKGIHSTSINWLKQKMEEEFDGDTIVVTHHPLTHQSAIKAGRIDECALDPNYWQYLRMSGDDWLRLQTPYLFFYGSHHDKLFDYADFIQVHGHVHVHEPLRYRVGASMLLSNASRRESLVFDVRETVLDVQRSLLDDYESATQLILEELEQCVERINVRDEFLKTIIKMHLLEKQDELIELSSEFVSGMRKARYARHLSTFEYDQKILMEHKFFDQYSTTKTQYMSALLKCKKNAKLLITGARKLVDLNG